MSSNRANYSYAKNGFFYAAGVSLALGFAALALHLGNISCKHFFRRPPPPQGDFPPTHSPASFSQSH